MNDDLTRLKTADLSLQELVEACAALLSRAPIPDDGRVQAVPDARTVRYYQSSGLVDRPLRYDGRQARYGWRHVLQVLAVKLLQLQGQRLGTIQRALAGQSDARLEAAVRDGLSLTPCPPEPAPSSPVPPRQLVSVALAPGVVLTLDPDVVSDPDAVVGLLHAALQGGLA